MPFPRFNIERASYETKAEFVSFVEQETREILGDISDRKFLVPHLNRVFEELSISYGEHKVPAKVLKSIEDKERRATVAKNTTA